MSINILMWCHYSISSGYIDIILSTYTWYHEDKKPIGFQPNYISHSEIMSSILIYQVLILVSLSIPSMKKLSTGPSLTQGSKLRAASSKFAAWNPYLLPCKKIGSKNLLSEKYSCCTIFHNYADISKFRSLILTSLISESHIYMQMEYMINVFWDVSLICLIILCRKLTAPLLTID